MIIVFLEISFLLTNSVIAQHNWEAGKLTIKSRAYIVQKTSSGSVSVKRETTDPKLNLKFGVDPSKGGVSITINSEKVFYNSLIYSFADDRIAEMAKKDQKLGLGIMLDESGIPFRIQFIFNPLSGITPEEILELENEILAKVRFRIRRQTPFGEPCIYFSGVTIDFQDILNGEIPALKISEQRGKEKAEWEQ